MVNAVQSLRTIETEWLSYLEQVLPPGAPDYQVRECRRAFYAGALAFSVLAEHANLLVGDAKPIQLAGYQTEFARHAAAVLGGSA